MTLETGHFTRGVCQEIWILGAPCGTRTDHINRKLLDNRRCNLRLADDYENARNAGLRRNNKSGFKGVSFQDRAWVAQITAGRRQYRLGKFATPDEAARAYDFAAIAFHGDFAVLNFSYSRGEILTAMKRWCRDEAECQS